MIYLLYISSAVHEMTDAELVTLLQASRENNVRDGITGVLLYKGGNFIQYLEGPEPAVLSLHQRIAHDPRHKGMMTLLSGSLAERHFGTWSMGFSNLDRLNGQLSTEDELAMREVLDTLSTAQNASVTPNRAFRFLLNFKELLR